MKNIPSTKIELNHNKIARIQGLDEFSRILFPHNCTHQKVFLAIFIELKYAPNQFLSNLSPLPEKYRFSPRMMETVRSKMRRMGLIDHVSRFNQRYGYREGWVFSGRFVKTLERLSVLMGNFRTRIDALQQKKDRDLFRYI